MTSDTASRKLIARRRQEGKIGDGNGMMPENADPKITTHQPGAGEKAEKSGSGTPKMERKMTPQTGGFDELP